MKNIIGILTVVLFVFFSANSATAQKTKPFQGTITYEISYSSPTMTPAQKAMLPTTETITIKDCKAKTETELGQGAMMTILMDGTTKKYIQILEYMGEKYAVKDSVDPKDTTDNDKKPTVTITQETKVISGYTCKKAILATKEDDGTVKNDTVFFASEIGCKEINFMSGLDNIEGTILEAHTYVSQLDATVIKKVKEVKKAKIADTVFLMPADAKEMTKEEFKKTFGGGE